jgi:hypothetical protein
LNGSHILDCLKAQTRGGAGSRHSGRPYDKADWRAEQLSAEADAAYTRILTALHQGFNGAPGKVNDAVGGMFEFKTIVGGLLQQQLTGGPNAGKFAGPRYKYVP